MSLHHEGENKIKKESKMKTTDIKTTTETAPAPAPAATEPVAPAVPTSAEKPAEEIAEEIATASDKKEKAKAKKSTKAKKSAKPAPKPAATKVERDLFGGRVGTRMSKINQCVIEAKGVGKTTIEIAAETKEAPGLVTAQLSWICGKGLCKRKEEKTADGKKVSRWTAVLKPATRS